MKRDISGKKLTLAFFFIWQHNNFRSRARKRLARGRKAIEKWQLMTQRDAMVAMRFVVPLVVAVAPRMQVMRLAGTAGVRVQSATSAQSPSEPALRRADPA